MRSLALWIALLALALLLLPACLFGYSEFRFEEDESAIDAGVSERRALTKSKRARPLPTQNAK
jgi:hypothetical protein